MRLIGVLVALAAQTSSSSALEVSRSLSVNASPAAVWAIIGDFCAIARWPPQVERCILSHDGDGEGETVVIRGLAASAGLGAIIVVEAEKQSLPEAEVSQRADTNRKNEIENTSEIERFKLKSMPIGLKCPTIPGTGVLELIRKNQTGMLYRARFYMKNRTAYRVTLESAAAEGRFVITRDVNANEDPSAEDLDFAVKFVKAMNPVREVVCEGSDDSRQKYMSLMRDNIELLKKYEQRAKQK
ncbi:hypothetical protein EKPJFOCH_0275 [Methylobacterium thuringiense]|uniref:SRPBCC family protein n=2 Tax=Methylobacterium thuringiense TaxID=1003091 RepID=A0ABQ4TH34_9HYPH|nr:hypothetical protein EKPJFOCH_0275 [Methylobacterium thuringiense]